MGDEKSILYCILAYGVEFNGKGELIPDQETREVCWKVYSDMEVRKPEICGYVCAAGYLSRDHERPLGEIITIYLREKELRKLRFTPQFHETKDENLVWTTMREIEAAIALCQELGYQELRIETRGWHALRATVLAKILASDDVVIVTPKINWFDRRIMGELFGVAHNLVRHWAYKFSTTKRLFRLVNGWFIRNDNEVKPTPRGLRKCTSFHDPPKTTLE